MLFIAKCVMIGIGGCALAMAGGYYFGGIYGFMTCFMGGFLGVIPLMMIIMKAKQKNFLKLFRDLKISDKEYEKFVHFPDSFGKIRTLIGVVKHPGVITIEGMGDFDDKGDEYAWGSDRAGFGLLNIGTTMNLYQSLYAKSLEDEGIFGYEAGLKKFFGSERYKAFRNTFRRTLKPDARDINAELQAVISEEHPSDKLERKILGVTTGFKNMAIWLVYAYAPISVTNAITQEKLITLKTCLDYKDKDKKYEGIGKLLLYVLFGLMIFLVVLGAMWPQVSRIFSGFHL